MLKAYIINKWILYISIGTPIISHFAISILKSFLVISNTKIPIDENNLSYYILAIISTLIIIFLSREKYSNINKEALNLSVKFENAVGLIFFGHFLLIVMLIILNWQPVLSFFALPVVILIAYLYIKGFSTAQNEIEKYKKPI